MAELTRNDIIAVLGQVDETLIAEILKSGGTPAQLAEARAWLVNEEAMINEGRPLPKGKVAELMDILSPYEAEEDSEGPPAP